MFSLSPIHYVTALYRPYGALETFFSKIDEVAYKPMGLMYESGSALGFIAIKTLIFLFNEPCGTTWYFSKSVALYGSVRFMYEKQFKQFIDSAPYGP